MGRIKRCCAISNFEERIRTEGCFVFVPIIKGKFILEYLGQVVLDEVFSRRMENIYKKDEHHYCCQLVGKLVIDAHRMGNECKNLHYCYQSTPRTIFLGKVYGREANRAVLLLVGRLVNHSCEPNSEMDKWDVDGIPRIGLFALRDIEMDEAISYDYNFTLYKKSNSQVNNRFSVLALLYLKSDSVENYIKLTSLPF